LLDWVVTWNIIEYKIRECTLKIIGINGVEMSHQEVNKVFAAIFKEAIIPILVRTGLYRIYINSALSAVKNAVY